MAMPFSPGSPNPAFGFRPPANPVFGFQPEGNPIFGFHPSNPLEELLSMIRSGGAHSNFLQPVGAPPAPGRPVGAGVPHGFGPRGAVTGAAPDGPQRAGDFPHTAFQQHHHPLYDLLHRMRAMSASMHARRPFPEMPPYTPGVPYSGSVGGVGGPSNLY